MGTGCTRPAELLNFRQKSAIFQLEKKTHCFIKTLLSFVRQDFYILLQNGTPYYLTVHVIQNVLF